MTILVARTKWASGLLALAALLCASGSILTGCSNDETSGTPAARKVALIGWDGATWEVIDPLLRRGELPNLARLIDGGGRAVLEADPPLLSPVVWTTIATGFPGSEHGITDFQIEDPHGGGLILASTLHRKRAPLWKIASAAGRTVGFVGWWTTWPAEPVRGYIVSDHLAYNRWDAWARRPAGKAYQLTFPAELAAELEPVAVRPDELTEQALTELVPFNTQERVEMMRAQAPVKFHGPSVFRFGYSTDASNAAFARSLLASREQPDLFGTTFILSDVAGHVFWHHYQPERYRQLEPGVGRLRDAIPNVYRRLDRWTGEILEQLDPETIVIVLSDHGMTVGHPAPRSGVSPAGDHMPDGIFAVSATGMAGGADLGTLSILDIAPTVLALMDLPVGSDMPGRVIEAVLPDDPAFRLRSVPTHGDGVSGIRPDSPSPGETDYEERLRSLGYIQ